MNFQSCKPFYSHPSFSQDPYPVPFVFISGNTLQQELIKRSVTNPWPNMVGFAVNNSGDQSDLYYLNDELALYATSCSKSPITEDNLRWIELDSKSRSDTQKLVDNYKFPPRFEGNHEYLQIENVLGKAQSSIADAIENDPPNVEVECKFDQIESLYDVYARTLNKIDYTTTESGALPSLSGLSTENFKSFLDQTIIDLPTDGLMLNANLEQIKADIAKLPQRNSLQFPDGTTEFAQNLLEQDLVLSNTVVIPRADTRALVEFDDGSHSGHQSSVASPLWDGNINFKGIPSWLFDLWGKENPMGDMQLESDDGWSSGKSEYSSGVSGGQSDTSSMGSARRVRIKRNIEESSSGFVPLTLPVPELVQTAPPLVRSASQPTPKHTAVKKKRKIGF